MWLKTSNAFSVDWFCPDAWSVITTSEIKWKCYLRSSWKAFLRSEHEKLILRINSSPRNVWRLLAWKRTPEWNRYRRRLNANCAFSNNRYVNVIEFEIPSGWQSQDCTFYSSCCKKREIVRPTGHRRREEKLMWQSNRKVTYEFEHAHQRDAA